MATKLSLLLGIYAGKSFGDKFDDFWAEVNRLSGHETSNVGVFRVSTELKPFLLKQFPWLADFDCDAVNPDTVFDMLAEMEAKYGVEVEIQPAPSGKITELDMIEELRFAGFGGEIIAI